MDGILYIDDVCMKICSGAEKTGWDGMVVGCYGVGGLVRLCLERGVEGLKEKGEMKRYYGFTRDEVK